MAQDRIAGLTVLLVEDDAVVCRVMTSAMERAGHRVLTVERAEGACKVLDDLGGRLDVIVLDYYLADGTAEPVMYKVLDARLDVAVVFMTGANPQSMRKVAAGLRTDEQLYKPFPPREQLSALERAFGRASARHGKPGEVEEVWLNQELHLSGRANALAKLVSGRAEDRKLVRTRDNRARAERSTPELDQIAAELRYFRAADLEPEGDVAPPSHRCPLPCAPTPQPDRLGRPRVSFSQGGRGTVCFHLDIPIDKKGKDNELATLLMLHGYSRSPFDLPSSD